MDNGQKPLTEHLSELRKRIIKPLASLLIFFVVSFKFSEEIFGILSLPLSSELKLNFTSPYIHIIDKVPTRLVFLAPAEAFWMHMKISFVTALILSLPVIFYQFWRFISPGLLSKEKKYLFPFILSASSLFVVGSLFCFFIVLPFALTFLLGYKTASFDPMISIGNYIDFCLKFILAFGIVFELPIVIIFLTKFGIVTPKTLAKHRKYAVLLAFVAAALLTPTPDAFNQTLMAFPIIILFEVGIILSKFIYRKKENV
jgi:sec-independent protein translocase protein TatC